MTTTASEKEFERKAFKAIFQNCSQHGSHVSYQFYTDNTNNRLVVYKIKSAGSEGYVNFPKDFSRDGVHGETIVGELNCYELIDNGYVLVSTDGIILGEDFSKDGLIYRDHC